jgi:hypothetical protein
MFEEKEIPPSKCALTILSIFEALPSKPDAPPPHPPSPQPEINKKIPWDFFDGAAQGTPSKGGLGGILHIT